MKVGIDTSRWLQTVPKNGTVKWYSVSETDSQWSAPTVELLISWYMDKGVKVIPSFKLS